MTIDLERMKGGMYVKATFEAIRHTVLPDPFYSKMIMKEFNDKLVEAQEKSPDLRQTKNRAR